MSGEIPDGWAKLSNRQQALIVMLDSRGPSSGATLAENSGFDVEPSTIYRDLSGLRKAGYTTKEPRDDREYEHRLTRKGRELLADAREWMCA